MKSISLALEMQYPQIVLDRSKQLWQRLSSMLMSCVSSSLFMVFCSRGLFLAIGSSLSSIHVLQSVIVLCVGQTSTAIINLTGGYDALFGAVSTRSPFRK